MHIVHVHVANLITQELGSLVTKTLSMLPAFLGSHAPDKFERLISYAHFPDLAFIYSNSEKNHVDTRDSPNAMYMIYTVSDFTGCNLLFQELNLEVVL